MQNDIPSSASRRRRKSAADASTPQRPPRTGLFVGFDEDRRPLLLTDAANAKPRAAWTSTNLSRRDVGREVLYHRVGTRLIITGVLHQSLPAEGPDPALLARPVLRVGARTMHLVAGEEFTIECGESSIKMTADGQIQIRGKFVTTHAAATNRVKGGSVHIN